MDDDRNPAAPPSKYEDEFDPIASIGLPLAIAVLIGLVGFVAQHFRSLI
ncbi:MAG: hypothetical protein IT422_05045 [Pirellulaceae bacterium]|nr:hypothetical protein [Pirellulaceae bacterium]